MKKISLLFLLFFMIACSTPEIYIPSYSLVRTDKNKHNQISKKHNTTSVVNIEDSAQQESLNAYNEIYQPKENNPSENLQTQKEKETQSVPSKVKNWFSSLFGKRKHTKKEYFTGGKIRSKFVMDDDIGESGLLYKYGYDGRVTSTVHIKHGLKNGLETLYDPQGRVMKRTPYVDGKKEGIVEVYYPDGKVLAQITYMNNIREGRASKYHHNGEISEEVHYVNGKIENSVVNDNIEIPIID